MGSTNGTSVEVEYFKLDDGSIPALDFIEGQPVKMRAKLFKNIGLLEEFGTALRMPYSEPLVDGIFQIRAVLGSDITRVLYFFVVGGKAILTHGFVKKDVKTPKSEIDRAKKYREAYMRRLEKEGQGS